MTKNVTAKAERGRRPWRAWYKGSRWRALRLATLARDAMRCGLCGRLCLGERNSPAAPVVDHVRPHRGDAALFFNPRNLRTLCKLCHDGAKAAEEARGWHAAPDAEGWPVDPRHPANRTA